MRWIYAKTPEELAHRREKIALARAWWKEFEKRADDLNQLFAGKQDWDLPKWIAETLQRIDCGLMWEFGPAINGPGHRLVITPESESELRPLVCSILENAPDIPGWEFYGHRLPEPPVTALAMVKARQGAAITGWRCVACSSGAKIDLYYLPSEQINDGALFDGYAFVLTESLLGEAVLDQWIGVICAISEVDLHKETRGEGEIVELAEFKAHVDKLIEARRDSLPDKPLVVEVNDEAQGRVYQYKPEKADDYDQQEDLLTGIGIVDGLASAVRRPGFYSSSFSRRGEVFCYLKTDGSDIAPEDSFEDRASIEDAIDAAIRPEFLGCVIGGGTGLRYSYVELALTDVEQAAERINNALRDGGISRRSWLLFHDCELCAEWIGVYDDSPPPPGF